MDFWNLRQETGQHLIGNDTHRKDVRGRGIFTFIGFWCNVLVGAQYMSRLQIRRVPGRGNFFFSSGGDWKKETFAELQAVQVLNHQAGIMVITYTRWK